MRVDVYLPFLLSLLLAAVSPGVARRLAPGRAARTLAVSAVVTASATVWGLLLLAATLLDDTPPVVEQARAHRFHFPEPVPGVIAVAAIAALAMAFHRLYGVFRTARATNRALKRLSESHPGGTELIVAASPQPQAFAIPGNPGRILVSSGMLAALDAPERHVLLAHERAHLAHHHARIRLAVNAAAAVNPLLIPVRETVAFLLERWADERAAEAAGDRRTAARALARAALATRGGSSLCALHFSEFSISSRVTALHDAPLPDAHPAALAVLAIGLLPALLAADATRDFVAMVPSWLIG